MRDFILLYVFIVCTLGFTGLLLSNNTLKQAVFKVVIKLTVLFAIIALAFLVPGAPFRPALEDVIENVRIYVSVHPTVYKTVIGLIYLMAICRFIKHKKEKRE